MKKGEELRISYVSDPKGVGEEGADGREGKRSWLKKWFEGGCGCGLCEKENQEREVKMKEVGIIGGGGEDMGLDTIGKLEGLI